MPARSPNIHPVVDVASLPGLRDAFGFQMLRSAFVGLTAAMFIAWAAAHG